MQQAQELALARLRQLSAHEVGHTLGLAHNFAASVNDRASVMDYPHPLVMLGDAGFANADSVYATGIGAWDKLTIAYGYADGTDERLRQQLEQQMQQQGQQYISDSDARAAGGAHADAHLWDNGKDVVAELERLMNVRQTALQNFSTAALPADRPAALLEEVLVPVYLMHRYQAEAVAKRVGGMRYSYSSNGKTENWSYIPAEQQARAFQVLLSLLNLQTLELPDHIQKLIPPRPMGHSRSRETFSSQLGVAFDPLAPASNVINLVIGLLLHPERASRLQAQSAYNNQLPDLASVTAAIAQKGTLFGNRNFNRLDHAEGQRALIQQEINTALVMQLMQLADNPQASSSARAIANRELVLLQTETRGLSDSQINTDWGAHYLYLNQLIKNFRETPGGFEVPKPIRVPDGSPIGTDGCTFGL